MLLIKNPGMVFKSIYYSLLYKRSDILKIPVRASWKAKIKKEKGADINIKDGLIIGSTSTSV
jgi:hypothetical protein